MNNQVENLNPDDVVCLMGDHKFDSPLSEIKNRFQIGRIFEFEEFTSSILTLLNLSAEAITELEQGTPCRVMTTRQQGWRWGKIRLKIELQFIPDELIIDDISKSHDSPLDEIRRISELDK
jgi:hypothetical protein